MRPAQTVWPVLGYAKSDTAINFWFFTFTYLCVSEADGVKWREEASGSGAAGGSSVWVLLTGAVIADGFSSSAMPPQKLPVRLSWTAIQACFLMQIKRAEKQKMYPFEPPHVLFVTDASYHEHCTESRHPNIPLQYPSPIHFCLSVHFSFCLLKWLMDTWIWCKIPETKWVWKSWTEAKGLRKEYLIYSL